jgi:hypothetical protein
MPRTETKFVEIEGELVKPFDTERAYLFYSGVGKPMWLPKSQVEWHEKDKDHINEGTMVIPRWLAVDKGLV